MKLKLSKYWVFQLAGWSLNFAIWTFFYLTLSVKKIEAYYEMTTISILIGLLSSHWMRLTIKQFQVLSKPMQQQIFYFLLATFLFAFLYASVELSAYNLLGLDIETTPKISSFNQLIRTFINNSIFLFIWNLIYSAYHYIERNRKQELQTLKLQNMVKELELKTIKSHINPHFIFNALNSIRALVDENPQRARTAITEISNILRSSMAAEKLETVTLERELAIVKDYLALEKIRFEERLMISFEIDETTLQLPIPPMMIQTLVENAIKHGVSKNLGGGIIKISSAIENQQHQITVINSGFFNAKENTEGFGLRSTQDRLNLLYQGKASFSIRNLDNGMVESKIWVPVN